MSNTKNISNAYLVTSIVTAGLGGCFTLVTAAAVIHAINMTALSILFLLSTLFGIAAAAIPMVNTVFMPVVTVSFIAMPIVSLVVAAVSSVMALALTLIAIFFCVRGMALLNKAT